MGECVAQTRETQQPGLSETGHSKPFQPLGLTPSPRHTCFTGDKQNEYPGNSGHGYAWQWTWKSWQATRGSVSGVHCPVCLGDHANPHHHIMSP